MLYLKVNRKQGEKTRRRCIELGILERNYKLISEGEFVYIPINKKIKGIGKIIQRKGTRLKKRAKTIAEFLEKKLTKKEIEKIITSYDLIGDVVIIEIPEEMSKKEKLIADAILEVHPNMRTVVKKYGPVKGKYRTRKVKVIRGKKTKETTHKEHNCKFKLNVEKVYYSVRLSGERDRINKLVNPKEKVLALFAGVGPFPIIIAKNHPKAEIIAIELNPVGVKYGKENLKLNKVKNVKFIQGDVNKVVPKRFKNWANRVLMPLPKLGKKFLGAAIKGTKNKGIIHFYSFVNSEKPFEEAKEIIEKECKKLGVSYRIISKKIIRSYSPQIVQVVIDFKVIR